MPRYPPPDGSACAAPGALVVDSLVTGGPAWESSTNGGLQVSDVLQTVDGKNVYRSSRRPLPPAQQRRRAQPAACLHPWDPRDAVVMRRGVYPSRCRARADGLLRSWRRCCSGQRARRCASACSGRRGWGTARRSATRCCARSSLTCSASASPRPPNPSATRARPSSTPAVASAPKRTSALGTGPRGPSCLPFPLPIFLP
jgi:hypothetical protein